MKTLFTLGFQQASFRPFSDARRLGEEEFTFDPVETTETGSGIITSYDQGPASTPIPDLYTSPTQGPAAQPVPNIVTRLDTSDKTPASRPAGSSDADWAKALAAGLKAAGDGYGAYTKSEIARMQRQAAELKAQNPSVSSILSQGTQSSSLTVPLVILGVGAAGLLALVLALK